MTRSDFLKWGEMTVYKGGRWSCPRLKRYAIAASEVDVNRWAEQWGRVVVKEVVKRV